MSMAAAINNSGLTPVAAACECGGDECDPCPWCQAQDAEADRRAREASADVEGRWWSQWNEVFGDSD